MQQKQSSKSGDGVIHEFWALSSGKPYFYVVIAKSKTKRFQLNFPPELSDKLPNATVPAQIFCRDKVWDLVYIGDQVTKKFGLESWGKFMSENNVTAGDACVFELIEGDTKSSVVKFKVQILKDMFPDELKKKAVGSSLDKPINVD
ncbi:B3 domain-containing protein Os04g0386900-like [Bidens hawaiensis]|uniref:B3 domain-containing protein Os04g0386900-like n=1 Tax=Bidens hawaiensis TaxID=980011 RepID=UPI004049113E